MKRKKSIKAITMIELGLAGVLLVVLSLLVFWYTDGLSSYSPKVVTYQCIGNSTIEYGENSKFREGENGISVTGNEEETMLMETPVMVKDSTDLILSKNMLLMVPKKELRVKRLNRFTKVSESAGVIKFEADKKFAKSFGGFLFDGKDLYIFLENTELHIGHNDIKLPPLSYACVLYNQNVEYYNSETKENKTMGTYNVDVTANCESGFVLNMNTDSVLVDGKDILIYSAVDEVSLLEME